MNFSLSNNDFSKLYIKDINDDFFEEYCDISSYLEYLFIKESELDVIDISSIGQISTFALSPDINIEDPGDLPGGGTGNTDTTSFEYAETLTLSDNELDQYNPSGSSSYNSDGSRKNDDIINIIPKDCFENQATYYYIGKEYGFYITTYEYGNNNKSIVFIFDIDTVVPGEGEVSCDCTVTITPKIQYVYEYSPSTLLVLPISSETHYNIKNVGVAFNIQNRDIPNYGSSNYDVNEDVGDYIISSYYNYLGSGSIIPDQSFYYDSVQFVIGFISDIGTATAIADYAWSILSNLNSGYYDTLTKEREQASPMYYNESFENDWATHIREYGGLIKTLNVKPNNQGGFIENPVIFGTKTGFDFVSATIKIDNYGGSENNVYSQLFLGVSMDILYDNSYYLGGEPINDYDVIVLDVENAFYYGEYKAY